ncbi:MAG: molybdopterin molybdotransferase MoeA [Planctomycetes bacterium]|jgi:molybdopterin molybdotransferase|nr:molybdopterin molybdotransferase MoeA [Planctomycetota bacterium]
MAKPLSLFEARAAVLAAARPAGGSQAVPLGAAHGRHLATAIAADGPWPATDRSAMDGFALALGSADSVPGQSLPVIGRSLAGHPFAGALPAGQAIEIMTGAVVPPGASIVVPVEQTSGFGGRQVTIQAELRRGANIRRAGSEVQAGAVVLPAGRRIGAAEIGVLAVLGHVQVPCVPRLRVAIVATGDEVVPVEQVPLPHQVRESNSWALAAQVVECGAEPLRLGVAADEVGSLRALLGRGLADCDVLVTIGGISKGTHDLVHGTLAELGVAVQFHGIDLKPGKPTFFGLAEIAGRRRYVFGLPGNPASSFTVFDLLVAPLLRALAGADPGRLQARAPAAGAPWSVNSRLQAVPARLVAGADGALVAELVRQQPSGDPFGLAGADVYALVRGQQEGQPGAWLELAGRSGGVLLP